MNQEAIYRSEDYKNKVRLEIGLDGVSFGSQFKGHSVILPGGRNASASETLALLLIANDKITSRNYHRSGHSGYFLCGTDGCGTVCWYTRRGDIPYMYGMEESRAKELILSIFPDFN